MGIDRMTMLLTGERDIRKLNLSDELWMGDESERVSWFKRRLTLISHNTPHRHDQHQGGAALPCHEARRVQEGMRSVVPLGIA